MNNNILNNIIQIENSNGDLIMAFKVDENGNIISMENCEIADFDEQEIRIQQINNNF